jgi:hypothetical protein
VKLQKNIDCQVLKVDAGLGLVMGWSIICKEDGKDYWDKQDDLCPEESMIEAATDFMLHSREAGEMHQRMGAGQVVFAFPLTEDIAKAFEIQSRKSGLMVAVKPDAKMMAKFVDGTYQGFSIGGFREEDEEV